jgi:hypothetical protein
VIGLEPSTNAVRVGPESALFAREASFTGFNWLPPSPPAEGERVEAQIPLSPPPRRGDTVHVRESPRVR